MSTDGRRADDGRELSAGGVVVRDGQVIVIVPTRRGAQGQKVLGLPKGHVDPGETAEQAATREVREEAGVDADLVEKLGDVRYFYQRDGQRIFKMVRFFLFDYRSGRVEDHDDEVEEARWMPLEDAVTALSYRGEREMVQRALSAISRER
jgi:8-oxo-dGTP pyrophosphatase MutT (NUDIX family)